MTLHQAGTDLKGNIVDSYIYEILKDRACTMEQSDLVKTGHWTDVTFSFGEFHEADKTPIGLSIVSGRCSECEKYSENLMQYSPEMPEYCSHCGAAMDLLWKKG